MIASILLAFLLGSASVSADTSSSEYPMFLPGSCRNNAIAGDPRYQPYYQNPNPGYTDGQPFCRTKWADDPVNATTLKTEDGSVNTWSGGSIPRRILGLAFFRGNDRDFQPLLTRMEIRYDDGTYDVVGSKSTDFPAGSIGFGFDEVVTGLKIANRTVQKLRNLVHLPVTSSTPLEADASIGGMVWKTNTQVANINQARDGRSQDYIEQHVYGGILIGVAGYASDEHIYNLQFIFAPFITAKTEKAVLRSVKLTSGFYTEDPGKDYVTNTTFCNIGGSDSTYVFKLESSVNYTLPPEREPSWIVNHSMHNSTDVVPWPSEPVFMINGTLLPGQLAECTGHARVFDTPLQYHVTTDYDFSYDKHLTWTRPGGVVSGKAYKSLAQVNFDIDFKIKPIYPNCGRWDPTCRPDGFPDVRNLGPSCIVRAIRANDTVCPGQR